MHAFPLTLDNRLADALLMPRAKNTGGDVR